MQFCANCLPFASLQNRDITKLKKNIDFVFYVAGTRNRMQLILMKQIQTLERNFINVS